MPRRRTTLLKFVSAPRTIATAIAVACGVIISALAFNARAGVYVALAHCDEALMPDCTQRIVALNVAAGAPLTAGQVTPVQFEVTNLGPADSFLVTVTDEANFLSEVAPATLTLGRNQSAIATASVLVPVSTTQQFDTLTIVAQSATNPAVNNSARVGLDVASVDSDADGIIDSVDQCANSNVGGTVVIDECNSGVPNNVDATGCSPSDRISQIRARSIRHGDFVSGVAHFTNSLVADGAITGSQKGAIQSCAARSNTP